MPQHPPYLLHPAFRCLQLCSVADPRRGTHKQGLWQRDKSWQAQQVVVGTSILKSHVCRPKGRCHIMVPAGGANAEGWLAFRDVLARIEAYTSRSTPAQVHTSAHMPQHTEIPSYNQVLGQGMTS